MNSLLLLFWDEIRGFVKSKVMITLWIGIPILAILMHFIRPDAEGLPLTVLTGLLIASLGGMLAAVMLSASFVNELNTNVYDLFLIRPIKKWHIPIAKYFAVFLCLIIATLISFALGLLVDWFTQGLPSKEVIFDTLKSLVMSTSAMAIACAIGILIGILVKSVALAAILAIYLGEQLSILILLPGILITNINPLIFSLGVGPLVAIIAIIVDIIVFSKKQF